MTFKPSSTSYEIDKIGAIDVRKHNITYFEAMNEDTTKKNKHCLKRQSILHKNINVYIEYTQFNNKNTKFTIRPNHIRQCNHSFVDFNPITIMFFATRNNIIFPIHFRSKII